MAKKQACEQAIRQLCGAWVAEVKLGPSELKNPSFISFKAWLNTKGYSHYLTFRSVMGADYDAELWFDQELKQIWRRNNWRTA